ncbi:MAG: hypothetical protein WBE65_15285, partial [Steroidobacteraceae bacterium]
AAGGAGVAGPAQWRSFNLLVVLRDLPHNYTCDDLWYRFHDLLLAIGARPMTLKILPYQCTNTSAVSTRSPQVQIQLELPVALTAAQARYADAAAVSRRVRLAPGTLKHLTEADCELLEQVNASLLVALPVQVVSPPLDCRAPAAARGSFALEVQALISSGA